MTSIKYGYTPQYLTRDGEPWFPMMGEFHYSRYPKQYWRESVYKMKAGGIDIISTYAFWIHHEEVEHQFDFTDQRDLRTFVKTVQQCNMTMFLRIGPWCHGEVRNGGFPDWVIQKDYEPRTNNEEYFADVERFYKKIAEQVAGLLYKDGGPIIGIQIENEYGHCGGLQGEEGEEHLRRLLAIAKKYGMEVPYYTATGWGGAVTGGMIPVMGGYCEAPWDQRLTEIEPSGNYIFTKERNDHNIGSDYGFGTGITFDIDKFPFLTAELGGGLQVTHHRRPVARAKDIGAMSMVKMGCGVNLLGYYMYHGGTNPKGKQTTLQESRETGYPNDLPVFSYDFSAPIREFGQMSETLKEIKLLSMFLHEFGSELCEMETLLPKTNPLYPNNLEDLRTSIRMKDNRGYLFVNNYQRRYGMKNHPQQIFQVELDNQTITFPPVDIKNGDFFFLPFCMKVGDGELKSTLATPLCVLHKNTYYTYIFYSDVNPEYHWMKEPRNAQVMTISREDALNAWKVSMDEEYLLITKSSVVEMDNDYQIINRHAESIKSYPKLPSAPEGYQYTGIENGFFLYECECNKKCTINYTLLREETMKKYYELTINYPEAINDCFLCIDFGGNVAKLYIDEEWVDDWFYTGETWEIGLKRFHFPKKIVLEIQALNENEPIFLEKWPSFKDGIACEVYNITAEVECVYRFSTES